MRRTDVAAHPPQVRRLAQAAVLVLAGCLLGQPQAVAPAAAADGTGYRPTAGPIFSDPTSAGSEGPDALRIIDALHDMIVNTPAGATIRIVSLRLNVPKIVAALTEAHQRGVTVRVVMPLDMKSDADVRKVATELNRRRTTDADSSYLGFCTRACYANREYSAAHAKLYLFSRTGSARNVVMSSSANIAKSGYRTAFNDAFVTVDNEPFYLANRRYFDGMRKDRTPRRNPYFSVSDRDLVLKFFPDFTSAAATDRVSAIVNSIGCRATGRAGDGAGHTVVSVVFPAWSGNRLNVLNRLDRLQARGCVVKVLITRGGVTPALARKFVASGLRVRYTDHFVGNVRTLYAHSKYIAISGGFFGDTNTSTVFTGSANMTLTATRSSDNTLLRIRNDSKIYGMYAANFGHIWDASRKLTWASLRLTAGQRAASRDLG